VQKEDAKVQALINAGTKKKKKMFEDETQESACCVNQFPHHARFVVSQNH
jgi:hypothetical protein